MFSKKKGASWTYDTPSFLLLVSLAQNIKSFLNKENISHF